MDKKSIISLQTEIIKEYQINQTYFNKIFMDIVRLYKGRLDLTSAETELLNFSWNCNDLLVDNTKLYEMLSKLRELEKSD